jgi:ABC-type glutathione transport system ATPase component
MSGALLHMHQVTVSLPRAGQPVRVLTAVDLTVNSGETLALVGESGSGKTTAALAVMRLLPPGATIAGQITLAGTDILALDPPSLRTLRGRDIGMVFQNASAALNPSYPVGHQIAEAYRLQTKSSARTARAHAIALLAEAGIVNPAARISDYPHQFSGGMRQRVMLAMALACSPKLLIADEPTSGLDPANARQTMALIARLQRDRHMAVLLITHDLSIVADHAHRVQVLHAGRTVEHGTPAAFSNAPRTPLQATQSPRLRVTNLSVAYPSRPRLLPGKPGPVLQGISFDLHRGECLGVVGPSGSGKSTLGRAVLQMLRYAGHITLDGQNLASLSKAAHRAQHRRIQPVFQDPTGSLNPTLSIAASIAEPLLLAGVTDPKQRRRQVDALLERVGLPATLGDAAPHAISGGQAQRAAIARALAAEADILVLDEPTSALDVSTQAKLLTLLADLQAERALSYLLISHNSALVGVLAHRILTLPDGLITAPPHQQTGQTPPDA